MKNFNFKLQNVQIKSEPETDLLKIKLIPSSTKNIVTCVKFQSL